MSATVGVRWLVTLAAVLGAATALAEVSLATSVSKVEATLDGGGRVKRELVPVDEVVPGEELRYTITFTNTSEATVDAERIIITNPIPDGTQYVAGSAGGEGAQVEYSTDGESFAAAGPAEADGGSVRSLRWTYGRDLAPGASGEVFFHVRMQ